MSQVAPSPDRPAAAVLRRPELLAPAGDWECLKAAIENGADAVYFGLDRFNARMRAQNFTQADLPEVMRTLHRRGLRGYVTFNTLVFADELAGAEEYLRTIIAAGVDAAIVQDVGICRLIRALSPDFPIHASTQMSISSAGGVEFARDLGAELVVLARENSLADIERIRADLARTGSALPLEVFVHGALCVAFSGQCLTSESLGGRSANRGECAQACRLPYDLVSDGQLVDLGDRRYLLSPQDLSGLDVLPELVRAGVASLKIEGRLKSPEYVAGITRVYRQALDRVMAAAGPTPATVPAFDPARARYELEMGFSRGLYPGWFRGINNQELAHARFGTKRGVFLGEIASVGQREVTLQPLAPLKPGDGVVFDAGRPDQKEEGGRIYQVEPRADGSVSLRFGDGDLDWSRLKVGQRLWKTSDPALAREIRATFESDSPRFQRPLRFEVHGAPGTPLTLIVSDELGHIARAASSTPLAPAAQRPLRPDYLRDQLGRLGGTPFSLGELRVELEGDVILPVSELNRLRRECVANLEQARAQPPRWTFLPSSSGLEISKSVVPSAPADATVSAQPKLPEMVAVIRQLDQLEPAWSAGIRTIYCEFENPKHYREAVVRFRELQSSDCGLRNADCGMQTSNRSEKPTAKSNSHPAVLNPQSSIWVAPPRVFMPGEEWILKQVRSCDADGYLVRNPEHLRFFAADRKRGDFSLNVANPLAAAWFTEHHGLERVTASYDLNNAQLDALLRTFPGDRLDITIHQRMPMFHMNHCVFCAFLSKGKDYRDCGRPCDDHVVALRDRVGADLPLKADAGCRNTVYNNRAQTGAEFVGPMLAAGARHFRIEFVTESPAEVTSTLLSYRRLFAGEISGADLWRELKLINQLGVTRGQLRS